MLSTRISLINVLSVNRGRAQIFSTIAIFFVSQMSIFSQLTVGQIYRISFADVDGNPLSTAEGRITVVVLISPANIDKGRVVGDRIPDFCLANPAYRMVTVLLFQKQHSRPIQMFLRALIRKRLDSEARRLQARYDQVKIPRNARQDVFAVADFDRAVTAQLGATAAPDLFRVFVFGQNGELFKQWHDVPTAEELAAVLKRGQ
jgi:hypothetical protein